MAEDDRDKGDGLRAKYEPVARRIKAVVEAGEITQEEAKPKISALKQELSAETKAAVPGKSRTRK
jgi:polyhydroxyalkanoate synthesis regulator phasin